MTPKGSHHPTQKDRTEHTTPEEVCTMQKLTQRATTVLVTCAGLIFTIIETAPRIHY